MSKKKPSEGRNYLRSVKWWTQWINTKIPKPVKIKKKMETAPYLKNILDKAFSKPFLLIWQSLLITPQVSVSLQIKKWNYFSFSYGKRRKTKNTRSHPYASKTGRDSARVDGLEVRNHYLESTMDKVLKIFLLPPPQTNECSLLLGRTFFLQLWRVSWLCITLLS